MRGRGTPENPANRFEPLHIEPDPDAEEADSAVPTVFFRDASRSILSENDSPDVGFRFSVNPYRGCEHGCSYCYARPSHEYLGFRAGLDFETRILVKDDAPELLRAALADPRWRPELIALSGNTDAYQPVERRLGITRRCLEVLCEFRNPVGVITKSALVQRDSDLLAELAALDAARVYVSITSLDPGLSGRLEPRAARPEQRLATVRALVAAGVPTGVLVAPVIPGLNDHEMPRLLRAAAEAGARTASWILLRLPAPLDLLFAAWLDRNYPTRREKVLSLVRSTRDGRISDSRFGHRMRGRGAYAEHLATMFRAAARRYRLDAPFPPASVSAFRRPAVRGDQPALF